MTDSGPHNVHNDLPIRPQTPFQPISGPATFIPSNCPLWTLVLTVHFSNPNKFCHNWTKLIDSLSALYENVNQVIFRQNGQFCSYLEILICLSRKPRDKSKVLNLIHLFINYQFIIWSKNFRKFWKSIRSNKHSSCTINRATHCLKSPN